jgi:hypothetical protein
MFGYLRSASSYRRVKLVMVGLAPILAISSVAIATTSVAGAVTPPLRCSKISGQLTASSRLSNCTDGVGGSGKVVLDNGGSPSTFTWANGKKTVATLSFKAGPYDCPGADTQEAVTGVVTKSTDSHTPAGGKVSGELCVSKSGAVSNVPGKPFTFKQP